MTGIYQIRNRNNGHSYVGLSLDIERRYVEHWTPRNLLRPSVLARALRKHGRDAFELVILEVCDAECLSDREVYWIAKLVPEYNMNEGGLGNKGHRPSDEFRFRQSIIARQQWEDKSIEEKRRIISNNLIGPKEKHQVTLETRWKLYLANIGRKDPPAVRARKSAALKGKPRSNASHRKRVWMIGPGYGFFPSVKDAGEFFKIHPSSISACIHGRQQTCLGHKWELDADRQITTITK